MPEPARAPVLRAARAADLSAMAALLDGVIAEGDKTAFQGPMTADDMDRLFVSGADTRGCILALDGDRLLGFQALGVEHLHGTGWADISSFVAPAGRGAGTGRALWRATHEAARARGLAGLRAVIRSVNTGAIGFYGACGFIADPGGLPDGVAICLPERTIRYHRLI